MSARALEEQNEALRAKIAAIEKKEAVVASRVATQVEKLTRENEVAVSQISELRKTCDALKQEVAALETPVTPDPPSKRKGSGKQFGKLLSMGKGRSGTFGSSSSSSNSPSPIRRPSESRVSPPSSMNRSPQGTRSEENMTRAGIPSFTPPASGQSPSQKSPSRMTRADSMPSFSPLPFRDRAATTSTLPMGASPPPGREGLKASSKLAAILGEQVEEMPTEEGITFMRDKETDQVLIRGGTLEALIDKLITHEKEGKAFADSFLITYRSFIEPPALFEALVTRYAKTFDEPVGEDGSSVNQDRMRLKILAFFRTWVDKFYHDWEELPDMLARYRKWLGNDVLGAQAKVAQQLADAADRKTMRSGTSAGKNQFDVPAPKPVRPTFGFTKVSDVDPTEMARQLCLVESRLFQAIKPKEYLKKGWEQKNKDVVAPHLSRFIAHFNKMGNVVAETVIDAPDDKKRSQMVEYWIKVAEKVYDMNNFTGLMEIIGGLGATSVNRLKKAWKGVSRNKMKTWDKLREYMSPQKAFANYRACIRTAHAPLIPYLGVYMQDMVFIEDGNPDFLKDQPDHINFHKRRLLADIIKDIQQHQLAPYNLEPVEEIIDFLALQSPEPETALYAKSLKIQPRESD